MADLLSIIVPVYNEEDVIHEFHRRIVDVCNDLDLPTEILYINDGSFDQTQNIIAKFREGDDRVGLLNFSRNFGKEAALTAGLDCAQGSAVIIIDSDLQDPPELIHEMLKLWREGHDVVYGQRISRDGETWFKKISAHMFYRILSVLSDVEIPLNTGDFRLMSRKSVDALKKLREHHRYMKGLFAWVGFPSKALKYRRDPRFAGKTKWNYWRLWNFAIEGITSFSTAPLKFSTYMGLLTAGGAFSYGIYLISYTLLKGNPVPGYSSLMVVILFLGGVQLISLGIIGEYLARTYNETKQRALYLVSSYDSPKIMGQEQGHSAHLYKIQS